MRLLICFMGLGLLCGAMDDRQPLPLRGEERSEAKQSNRANRAHLRPEIGSIVPPELKFRDIHFHVRQLNDEAFKGKKAMVFVAVNNGCPLVPRYFPMLARMEKEYREKGVQFVALNVGLDETILEMAKQAVEFKIDFPFMKDIDGQCVEALGLERTPEVVVLDSDRKIRYRGRISDQYAPGKSLSKSSREDLKIALDELLDGKAISVPSTACEGCKITLPELGEEKNEITYAEHIALLIHKHCAECHRKGGLAPFALNSYEQLNKRADMVAEVVGTGQMPPWYGVSDHVKMINSRVLTSEERSLVDRWLRGGKKRGDEKKFPIPQVKETDPDEWVFGKPDLIIESDALDVAAEGDIPYIYAGFNHRFNNEAWIESIEIKPSNPKVVHHANLFYISQSEWWKINDQMFITGYVPGNFGMNLEPGMAYRLPPKTAIMSQIHFVGTGKPEKCSLKLGIRFPRATVEKRMRPMLLDLERFHIPANTSDFHLKVKDRVLDCDAVAIAFFTHMHKRGKSMLFRAKEPQKDFVDIFSVPNYNFDWQLACKLQENQLKFPKGTIITAEAVFDNSRLNSKIDDPNRVVPSGFQTYNEMLQGFLFYVDAHEKLNLKIDSKTGMIQK